MRNILVVVGFLTAWNVVGITMESVGVVDNYAYMLAGSLLTSVLWATFN